MITKTLQDMGFIVDQSGDVLFVSVKGNREDFIWIKKANDNIQIAEMFHYCSHVKEIFNDNYDKAIPFIKKNFKSYIEVN